MKSASRTCRTDWIERLDSFDEMRLEGTESNNDTTHKIFRSRCKFGGAGKAYLLEWSSITRNGSHRAFLIASGDLVDILISQSIEAGRALVRAL